MPTHTCTCTHTHALVDKSNARNRYQSCVIYHFRFADIVCTLLFYPKFGMFFIIFRTEQGPLPTECALKVYKTTLSEFKTREKYIKEDHRFKERFTKQNPRKIIRLWAEKEFRNLKRFVGCLFVHQHFLYKFDCQLITIQFLLCEQGLF